MGCKFKIISKIGLDLKTNKFISNIQLLKKEIIGLKREHHENIHAILLHSPTKQFLSNKKNFDLFFEEVKNIIGPKTLVGVSLRSPEDITYLKNKNEKILIEANLSWFDLRVLNYLNNNNFQILARSVYASAMSSVFDIEFKRIQKEVFWGDKLLNLSEKLFKV